ncbi:hypothetical protein [Bacteroides hominis]|uniref:hypothetical protein n=1 Tax=Bacteroides hominis TaxID=2763023 RepID=UPI00164AD509|nr:hypothetical protein [Bacteroides hominis (ex Liu et al. 2022)]MBC5612889.1 hypothetical protein [Bacteroides hominis (ex Liu et al. 2022)]
MADKRESDLNATSECSWIRVIDNKGNSSNISKDNLINLIQRGSKKWFNVAVGSKINTGFSLEGIYTIHVAYSGNISVAVISSYSEPIFISNGASLSTNRASGLYFGRLETNGELYLINNTDNSELYSSIGIERL